MRQQLFISMIALAIPMSSAYAQATPPSIPVKPSPATLTAPSVPKSAATGQQSPTHAATQGRNGGATVYGGGSVPTEMGNGSQISTGGATSATKVTPAKPPISQTQSPSRIVGAGGGLAGDGGTDSLSASGMVNSPNALGGGKDTVDYRRRPDGPPRITTAPSPASQAAQQKK